MVQRIISDDSPHELNSKLISKYKTSLFDFSYLLTIALSGEFLRQKFYGMKKKDLSDAVSLLEKTKIKFAKYDLLGDLISPIEDKLQSIKKIYIDKNRGIYLSEKTKLIFLWTQILRKKRKIHYLLSPIKEEKARRKGNKIKEISIKELPFSFEYYRFATEKDKEGGKEIIKAINEESVVNWDHYYRLLKWFHHKLENCSYSSLFKPELNRKDEVKRSIIRLNMSYWKYRRSISIEIDHCFQAQEYFKKRTKRLPLKITNDGFICTNAYPIIIVHFKKDSIEIGELRKKGIMLKKVRFLEKRKVMSEILKTDMKIECPTIIFPSGDPLTITNYTPPGDLSTKLRN